MEVRAPSPPKLPRVQAPTGPLEVHKPATARPPAIKPDSGPVEVQQAPPLEKRLPRLAPVPIPDMPAPRPRATPRIDDLLPGPATVRMQTAQKRAVPAPERLPEPQVVRHESRPAKVEARPVPVDVRHDVREASGQPDPALDTGGEVDVRLDTDSVWTPKEMRRHKRDDA
jgi:hypothetical protein